MIPGSVDYAKNKNSTVQINKNKQGNPIHNDTSVQILGNTIDRYGMFTNIIVAHKYKFYTKSSLGPQIKSPLKQNLFLPGHI